MELEFNSLRELYKRVSPALSTKKIEMHRAGYTYIENEDIWNYLKESKWKSSFDLSLAIMVSDILNSDNLLIDDHFKNKIKNIKRIPNLDEE